MQFRLGGDQTALAGGLQHGRFVSRQVGLDPLQRGDGGVQSRELGFDSLDDAVLFGERGDRYT